MFEVHVSKHSLFRLKSTVGCLTSTYPSIHFSLDEDTLKITVGYLVCGVVCGLCVCIHVVLCVGDVWWWWWWWCGAMCGCCVGAVLVWGGVCVSFLSFLSFLSQLSSLSFSFSFCLPFLSSLSFLLLFSLLSSFFSFSLSLSLSLSEHCVKNRSTNKLRGVLM